MTDKQMLEIILKLPPGKLKRQEAEMMGDLWDCLHRYGSLTRNQASTVHTLWGRYDLDKKENWSASATPIAKIQLGVIRHSTVKSPVYCANLAEFEAKCPQFPRGSKVWLQAANFMKDAAHQVELRPAAPKRV